MMVFSKTTLCGLLVVLMVGTVAPHPRKAAEARQQRAAAKAAAAGGEPAPQPGVDPNCPNTRVDLKKAVEILKKNDCAHMAVGGLWPKHAVELGEALADNTALMMLDLNQYNEVGDDGAAALGKALSKNRSLKALFVANNAVSEDGAESLAEALDPLEGGNDSLQSLDLGANEIGVAGAKALAKALKHNKGLRALYLGSNGIGDKGAKAFAATLKTNDVLGTLFMRKNRITDVALKALVAAMEKNTALTKFDVEPYKLSISGQGGDLKSQPATPDDNVISPELLVAMKVKVMKNNDAEVARWTEENRLKEEAESKANAAKDAIAGSSKSDEL